MALFGASDEYVPLLTAFYQAEPGRENPVGSELDVLMWRYSFSEPHSTEFWSSTGTARAEKQLRELAAFHAVIVRLMDAAADNSLPKEDDMEQFNRKAAAILTPPKLRFTGVSAFLNVQIKGGFYVTESRPGKETLFVRPPRFGESYSSRNEIEKGSFTVEYQSAEDEDKPETAHSTRFMAAVLTEFAKAIQSNVFTRCDACRNPFAARRPNQRFCSDRCRARTSQKRRRVKMLVTA